MKIYEIKKSKFIAYLYNVSSKEEVKKIYQDLKIEHKKARHIVYAYLTNNNRTESGGYSDDREPKGTAGLPLFNLLKNKKISNKAIFIVRYFGGIKLGASNLLRAYITSATMLFED